ncbi:hypothetical protein [Mycobacteroides abscessus]|uniref:hypothetical protein n=1 Tax=Mycobacteroides abscessus TaxID=36809 RepID=UPI0011C407CD|nr:hypothetical protein [Mycobacteroides abscessus]
MSIEVNVPVLRIARVLAVAALIIVAAVAFISPEAFAAGLVECAGRIYAMFDGLAASVVRRG